MVIGYNVNDNRLDHYHYDLLASESRLASFIAIAKGEWPRSTGSVSAASSRASEAGRR